MKRIIILFIVCLSTQTVLAETLEPFAKLQNRIFPPAPVKNFTLYGGEAELVENVVHLKSSPGSKLIYDGEILSAGTIAVDVFLKKGEGGNFALIVNVSQPRIGADAFYGMEIGLFADEQRMILGRHRNNFEQLHSTPCEIPLDRWFRMTVQFDQKTYRLSIDGKEVAVLDDPEMLLKPGKVGFRPWNRNVQLKNFQLEGGRPACQTEDAFSASAIQIPFEKADVKIVDWPNSLKSFEGLPPIALITHYPMTAPPAVGQDFTASHPRKWGCSIRIIEPSHPEKQVRTIFNDSNGCIYDLNRSFDGQTLYFSYRKENERNWNIWKIQSDGTGLQQLTSDNYYNVAPCEMPDGRLIFVSSRRFGHTVCQPGPASNLYTMNPDGNDIRCVSMNTLSDMSPQILSDGRILFTRWEYIDRDLTYRQSLWTQYPDGTAYRLHFGNTIRDVGTFWQARPIPGRFEQTLATFAPHHGYPHGAIGIIDRSYGVEGDKGKGFRYITKEFPSVQDSFMEWAYRDPYPINERLFLCAYGSSENFVHKTNESKYRIYLLDAEGEKRILYEDPQMSCYYPISLEPMDKPLPIAPQVVSGSQENERKSLTVAESAERGSVFLVDVYHGMESQVPRGTIKTLRIMEQIRKTEELVDRAFDQSPVMSYGTYYAKRNWGEVPIEDDGSAFFTVPALREIYFQVLDDQGREVHRMTSALQVMPGEKVGCIGCHENRDTAPPVQQRHLPKAMLKNVNTPQLPAWYTDRPRTNPKLDIGVFDYPSLVQPVLDKYCTRCHADGVGEGGYDLTGDKTRYFSMSYDNLLGKSRSYRQHDMLTGVMLPQETAKGKPLVHFFWLLWTPSSIYEPYQSGTFGSRLPEYLDEKHCGEVIPLEERKKIYFWLDADVPYYGTYAHSRPRSPGRRDLYTEGENGRLAKWFTEDFDNVFQSKCSECHEKIEGTTNWEGRYAWLNLSRPKFSSALTTHMPKEYGGRGVEPIVFKNHNDSGYKKMLRAIEKGKTALDTTPTADLPDFKGQRAEP